MARSKRTRGGTYLNAQRVHSGSDCNAPGLHRSSGFHTPPVAFVFGKMQPVNCTLTQLDFYAPWASGKLLV